MERNGEKVEAAPSHISSPCAGRSACGIKTAAEEDNSSHCCGEELLGVDSSGCVVKSSV